MSTFLTLTECNNDLATRMDAVVRSYYPQSFMGFVLVARGSRILFEQGYGAGNLEWNTPNTRTTKFRIGSLTKQFTAASVLLLQQRGKLGLDDSIRKYLPELPPTWNEVKVYHLLTHTSGVANFTLFPEFQPTKMLPSSPQKTLLRFRDKPLEFRPGQQYLYSSSGYIVLGLLIQRISGQAYRAFLQEHIFGPLEMLDSGYDCNGTLLCNRAAGYKLRGGHIRNADYIDMSIPFSAGGLYSTAADLLRWQRSLVGGEVLAPGVLASMITPYLNDYACGFLVRKICGQTIIEHGSGIEGFNSYVAQCPESSIICIALSNLSTLALETIVHQLAALALGEATSSGLFPGDAPGRVW